MAQNLPTYEEATSRDPWRLVGPYIHPHDLYAACLVSRQWFKLFTPLLWGEPASKFGGRVGRYLDSFIKFLIRLNKASLCVRRLVHTVDLSALRCHMEGPDVGKLLELLEGQWLRHLLCGAPKLQSLVVCNCPIISHLALASTAPVGQTELHLLNASLCNKATSKSLSEGLAHFPALAYLDLSSTESAGTWEMIRQISSLSRLRILKLRRVGLQDSQMEALARALGTRVWSLDVRNNNLSDMCIDALLNYCFLPPDYGSSGLRELQDFLIALQTATENAQNRPARASSSLQSAADAQAQEAANPPPPFSDIIHNEPIELEDSNDSEAYIASYLASHPHAHIELSERPKTGLTNLYVAGNVFTVNGVAQLLRTARLKSFDCGTLRTNNIRTQLNLQTRVEDLIQELANSKLTYLRIDHRIFCGDGEPKSSAITMHSGQTSTAVCDELELVPSILPNLQHLVLTDVPTTVKHEHFTDALKAFLRRLADQEREVAHKKASGAAVWASLPASVRAARRRERDRNSRVKKGLQSLDLELASRSCKFGELWRSVTEDTDGETFQQASANDYSFFTDPEYKTTSSLLEPDGAESLRLQIMNFDMGSANDPQSPPPSMVAEPRCDSSGDVEMTSPPSPPPSYDNAAYGGDVKEIIAGFRRERREKFEEEVRMGRGEPGAGGHWSGRVRILRNA